ncbi:MAG: acetylornithine deacetylase [Legionellaceae bacterium]|nr:acetylornithine deacetylase [Legionellaceae bacterium]
MDTLQWLTRLIECDTTSSRSNIPLIKVIEAWLHQQQIDSRIIYSTDKRKANLFVTLPSQDGKRQGGLLLSGHTDVVPVEGQIWDTDPFIATERDSKIYGRGTCDMKGFIAVLLALAPEIKAMPLKKPVHFSLTCDEEIGCLGVPDVLEYIRQEKLQPEACIVGEPSAMKPVTGHKGRLVFHAQFKGQSSHSSLAPYACNAIEYACRLINFIRNMADSLKENGPFDHDFDVPFTTMTTTMISGGQARNIIPENCEFLCDIRYLPDFPVERLRGQLAHYIHETLLPEMQRIYPGAAIDFDVISNAAGFNIVEEEPITSLLRSITGIQSPIKVSYSTEAAIIQRAHIPTIICGPGDIAQAHRPNEFISKAQLNLCEKVLRNAIHFFCLV